MSSSEGKFQWVARLGRIASWVVGTILLINAAAMILAIPEGRIAGFGFLVAGLLILPPTAAYVREKAQPPVWAPPIAAVVAVVAAFGVQAALAPGAAIPATPQEAPKEEARTSLAADSGAHGGFVKQFVSKHLLDPESARFADGIAYRMGDRLSFCGTVNAKNRFGGYTGPQPYVVADSGFYMGDTATAEVIFRECKGEESSPFTVF